MFFVKSLNTPRLVGLELLKTAWPLILGSAFWNVQILVDRIFLGQHSTDALGATLAVNAVFWAPMALLQQTVSYSSTFVAQSEGAQRQSDFPMIFWHSVLLALLGGLFFSALPFFSSGLFDWSQHPEPVLKLEKIYWQTICLSALPIALLSAVTAFLTGIKKTAPVFVLTALGAVANVILDWLFIFGNWGSPQLGIAGAGLATALSSYVATLAGFTYLVFVEKGLFRWSGFSFSLQYTLRFLKFGVPNGMQWALEGLAFTVFLFLIGRSSDGAVGLGASSVAVSLMMLAIFPPLGLSQAISVHVGQLLGAQKKEAAALVTWTGLKLALVYVATLSALFYLFPYFFIDWFATDEQVQWLATRELSRSLLVLVSIFILFDTLNLIFSAALKGAGDTLFVSAVALIAPWPLMVLPTAWVIAFPNATHWGWIFCSVFICTQGLIFFLRFQKGKWKNLSVLEGART